MQVIENDILEVLRSASLPLRQTSIVKRLQERTGYCDLNPEQVADLKKKVRNAVQSMKRQKLVHVSASGNVQPFVARSA